MNHHPIFTQLDHLRFHGMARALRDQFAQPDTERLAFLERLALLLDCEASDRENKALSSRLRRAKLHQVACMENIDYRTTRGLDQRLMLQLANGDWIRRHLNVIVTSPTGTGKSYLACALAHKACLEGFTARYHPFTAFASRVDDCSRGWTLLKVFARTESTGCTGPG